MSASQPFRSFRAARVAFVAAIGCLAGCNFAPQAMNADGVRLYQQGNLQGASSRFMQAIAHDPADANAYYNLAATLHQSGRVQGNKADLQQAENYYNQCLDRDPNHVNCYRGLAVLLADTGRTDAALRLIEGWSMRNPTSPEPKIEMARLLEELGETDKAKARLEEALEIQPDNARALAALGRLRDMSGEHAQALANYQRSLSENQFQPQVAARASALQAAFGGPSPVTTSAGAAHVARQPVAAPRY